MGRNLRIEGITLRSRRFQEFHKDVTILSREGGVFQAVLHGGYKGKSRLAGGTEPFRRVNFLLYHNPVKESFKISDGEVLDSFEALRGDLARIYLASLWSEIMIKTRGMGAGQEEGEEVFLMLLEALTLADSLEREKLPILNIQFLWRLLESAGLNMDIDSCSGCGRRPEKGRSPFFSLIERGIFCGDCGRGYPPAGMRGRVTPLSLSDFPYLRQTLKRPMGEAVEEPPPQTDLLVLERIPLKIMVSEMDIRLKTSDYHPFLED